MDPSSEGQRSGSVTWAGPMNGSRITAEVTVGSGNLFAGTTLSEQSGCHAKHYEPMVRP